MYFCNEKYTYDNQSADKEESKTLSFESYF